MSRPGRCRRGPQTQVGLGLQPAEPIARHRRIEPGRPGLEAGGPDHGLHRNPFGFSASFPCPGEAQLQAAGLQSQHAGVAAQAHVAALEGGPRLLAVEGAGLGQKVRPPLDQLDQGGALQHIGQLAGQFHAAGACPHHRQPLQRPCLLPEPLHKVLQPIHIRKAAEEEGVLPHPGHREGGGLAAGGDHQSPVAEGMAGLGVHLRLWLSMRSTRSCSQAMPRLARRES